jgi:hypothetical protein
VIESEKPMEPRSSRGDVKKTASFTLSARDLESYALLRVRIRDFIHLTMLWARANNGEDLLGEFPNHGPAHVADTLRTASLGWLASLVDRHNAAVNAFRIWPVVFPHRQADIAAVEKSLGPYQRALEDFRGSVAFHTNKGLGKYHLARKGIIAAGFSDAIEDFLALAEDLLLEEDRMHGLQEALDPIIQFNAPVGSGRRSETPAE